MWRWRLWNWVLWLGKPVPVVLLALALFLTVTPQGQTGVHTFLFVTQVLNMPVKPQSWFTKEPVREEVTYPRPGGEGVADIYRIPDGKKRAAVLLFLGANAAGRDDEDVINLGKALGSAGFVTMFHWSPTMALQYNIDLAELENLVWAFQYLREQPFVDQKQVGMGGFCVGASFALVAASDARIRDKVVFVNAFGPYYDAHQLLLQLSSRSRFYQDQREAWEPDHLTVRVLANELIETLADARERELLRSIFVDGPNPTNQAPAGTEGAPSLSEEATLVYQLLTGTTIEEVETIYQALPSQFRDDMKRISPSTYIGDLQARAMVMHDRNDRLVPAAESRRLADALQSRGNFRYTEFLAFQHVRAESGGGIWQLFSEGFKLFRHTYGIIRVAY